MIQKIAHLADIHIRKSIERHEEYREVFKNLYASLRKKKPDRIVIVGDLFHDYIDFQPEAIILAIEFLNELSKIAPVRITRGNHDMRKKSKKRMDSIEAAVTALDNDNVIYYNETGFFDDDNVTWAVWKHGDNKSPWRKRSQKPKDGNTTIDLFHDPVQGAMSNNDYVFDKDIYTQTKFFNGNYTFLGDIHLLQFLSDTMAYPSSLVEQNFAEGDGKFHGYILWDISNSTHEEIPIANRYAYNTIEINPFTEFDELELELPNPQEFNRVRVIWKVLAEVRSTANERAVESYLKNKYNIKSLSNKNEFLENQKIEVAQDIEIDDITHQGVQHEIFTDYLTNKLGVESETIEKVLALDDQIAEMVELEELTNVEWSLLTLEATNFMSYEHFIVDWNGDDGLYQITGLNTAGKTTVMKLISYVLYGKTLETQTRQENGDARHINNRNGATFCEGKLIIEVNSKFYKIERRTELKFDRKGALSSSPTTIKYNEVEITDDNVKEVIDLTQDGVRATQSAIEDLFGSFDNFNRTVITTSDTLNLVLSNDDSVFKDSLIRDSGVDVFDRKNKAFKSYLDDYRKKPRINVDVVAAEKNIVDLELEIKKTSEELVKIERQDEPALQKRIEKGEAYIYELHQKLHSIDPKIANLDLNVVRGQIHIKKVAKDDLLKNQERIEKIINELPSSFDEEEYNRLLECKEKANEIEYGFKSRIKDVQISIRELDGRISMNNGQIVRLKQDGVKLKVEVKELQQADVCPACGQKLDDDHVHNLNKRIAEKMQEMKTLAEKINSITEENSQLQSEINKHNFIIDDLNKQIADHSTSNEQNLVKLGDLINQRNHVQERETAILNLEKNKTQIEMNDLQILSFETEIHRYNDNLKFIEENKKIEGAIANSRKLLNDLREEVTDLKDQMYGIKSKIADKKNKIKEIQNDIALFLEQEEIDNLHKYYAKCVHRNGIPTLMLQNYIVPRINEELQKVLDTVPFSVYLEPETMKMKLCYDRIDNAINVLEGSGKERTFAAVALKFALNQVNAKSKPSLFLLDEVMGKLTEESVDEFIELIGMIKQRTKKVLVVEHNHEIHPDYIINVEKSDKGISSLTLE
jgi:Holliday junction resolvase